jgi:Fungal Zn(2)-Cys(6) binuclear cluster domain
MHHLTMTQEAKLRAACDRCHDLKNRCVRTGGPESRCDRCGRLDIDCVYRNTSRMGRPKAQRRTSVVSQPQPGGEHNYENGSREANTNSRRDPNKRLSDTPQLAADKNQAQAEVTAETRTNGNTTLNESPSDVMSLLVSPEG